MCANMTNYIDNYIFYRADLINSLSYVFDLLTDIKGDIAKNKNPAHFTVQGHIFYITCPNFPEKL